MSAGFLLFLCVASCGAVPYPTPANHSEGNSTLGGGVALGRACNETNPCPDLTYMCSFTGPGRTGSLGCVCLFGSPDALGKCPDPMHIRGLGPCKTNEDCLVPDSLCMPSGLPQMPGTCQCLVGPAVDDEGGCQKLQLPEIPIPTPPVVISSSYHSSSSSESYSSSYSSYGSSSRSSSNNFNFAWLALIVPAAIIGIVCRIMICRSIVRGREARTREAIHVREALQAREAVLEREAELAREAALASEAAFAREAALARMQTRTIWLIQPVDPETFTQTPASREDPEVGESSSPAEDLPPSYGEATGGRQVDEPSASGQVDAPSASGQVDAPSASGQVDAPSASGQVDASSAPPKDRT